MMERSTERKDEKVFLRNQGTLKWRDYPKYVLEAYERLAAYEDSDLSPERVAELAQAEKDGRILPEGFNCVMLSDGKTLALVHLEGKTVYAQIAKYGELCASQQL